MRELPGRIRDATFQVVADACDARTGLSCFALARMATCGHVAGFVALGYLQAVATGPDAVQASTVTMCFGAFFGSLETVLVAFLAHAERRMAPGRARAVIPLMREPTTLVAGLTLLGIGTYAALVHLTHPHPATHLAPFLLRLQDAALVATCVLQPVGSLFAGCEWRRLRRRTTRRAGLAPQAA